MVVALRAGWNAQAVSGFTSSVFLPGAIS